MKKPAHAKVTTVQFLDIFPQYFTTPPRSIAPERSRPEGKVARNSAGQRIDQPIVSSQLDRKLLQDNKSQRLCNEYHLRGSDYCKYGAGCKFVHGAINDNVRRVLQDLAKYTHCKFGTGCAYLDCYAGHRCPYDRCRGTCEFPKEMHFADRVVVNWEPKSEHTSTMPLQTRVNNTHPTQLYECPRCNPEDNPLTLYPSHPLSLNTLAAGFSTAVEKPKALSAGVIERPSTSTTKTLPALTGVIVDRSTIGPVTPGTSGSSTDWRQHSMPTQSPWSV